jgi:GntR family transcriptional repressor for pyruvate dehydrogenase complex
MTQSSARDAPFALNRGNAAQQIIGDLRDQILGGVYPRGSKLPTERELAQRYGVSIPTVREAIRGLSAVHLVEPRHGTGVYVIAAADLMFAMAASTLIELENIQLLDVLDLLEALQGKAAVLACTSAGDDELVALGVALDELEQAQTNDELADRLRVFLRLLADVSHNALITTLNKFLADLLIEILQDGLLGLGKRWPTVAAELSADRRSLVEAIKQRDAERARKLTVDYNRHTKRLVAEGLGAGPGEPEERMRLAMKRAIAR